VTPHVTVGRPAEAIVATADEVDAGLLVVGARGHSALAQILLGSVSTRVVRLATRPVLVARAVAAPPRLARVLVATDFSPASEAALATAVELADETAAIELFHVRHVLGAMDLPGRALERIKLDRELAAAYEERAQAWIRHHQRGGQTLRFVQEAGPVAKHLFSRLVDGEARYDLVALGAHGGHGFARLILGGIAESTVRHAPCSTLIAFQQP